MRLRSGGLAVFCIALLASLGVHLPVYEVLGKLAEVMLRAPEAERSQPVELELAPLTDATKPVAEVDRPEPEPTPAPKPPPAKRREREVRAPKPKPAEASAELHKPEPAKVEEVPAVPAPPPPDTADNPLAVTQKSADPTVETPENARFIAEENQRVEQETIARMRNLQRDDPAPTPAANAAAADKPEPGDASETDVADLQEVRGSDERPPNLNEAEQQPVETSQPSGGEREAQALEQAAETAPAPSRAAEEARSAADTAATAPETLVVQDAAGTFTIRKQAPGPNAEGKSEAGQRATEREAQAASRENKGKGVNLRVSFSQFESTFGADELREQRAAYLEQRRSQVAGGPTRQQKWRKFRAAIENFVPNVQPGEQSALNTAASPFADYLAHVHRRIHREFAHRFLGSLPIAGGPFDDRSLHAELEIVINGDGSVHQVGVAQTSGFLPFDYGAFDAVMRAGPYPVPPRKILSGDGRVYFHWGFYRNERQCGTFNARPYILPHPKGTPGPAPSPLQDRPEREGQAPPAGGDGDEPAVYDERDGELGRLDVPPARDERR